MKRHTLTLGVVALALALGTPPAHALEPVAFLGGSGTLGGAFADPGGVAVNSTGAGPANAGDVYALDFGNARVQRFGRDDNGTPADVNDDTYFFISAWGADVVQSGGAGDQGDAADANYEVCTVAAECKAGVPSGGNGSAAGNGALFAGGFPVVGLDLGGGIAVDQDTGHVYVFNAANSRVNVYDGAGAFLRSFGWDVVAPGSPNNLPNAERQTATLGANTTGGSFALSFQSATGVGRVDTTSTLVTDVTVRTGAFQVGDTIAAYEIAPGTTITAVDPVARTITLSEDPIFKGVPTFTILTATETTGAIAHDASAAAVQAQLEALPAIGAGNVSVSGPAGGPYAADFLSDRGDADLPQLSADPSGLTVSSGTPTVDVATTVPGASYEVCAHADGDVCKAGTRGSGPGQMADPRGIAVSAPDGNSETGTVFLADNGNQRVNTYALDGSSPASIGSGAVFSEDWRTPTSVAVDSRGIVYVPNRFGPGNGTVTIERYDSQNANGEGVGFLDPIPAPPLGSAPGAVAVDPDTDGAGPDTDVLYSLRYGILQFGPANPPGLSAPPAAVDDIHASAMVDTVSGVAVDAGVGRLYVAGNLAFPYGCCGPGVYAIDESGPPPTATLDSIAAVTSTSATLNATIDPNGPPPVSYRFEYSTDGAVWTLTPSVQLGTQEDPQAISDPLDPPPLGLEPNTLYHVRVVATKLFADPVVSNELTFATDPEAPQVETAGAPHRTTTTAQLNGRVSPRNTATQYWFEHGDQGPCSANPCDSTTPLAAGSDNAIHLVAEEIDGLAPDTTYHYRLAADNGVGGPVFGADVSVHTRASDALADQNTEFPGPPASDRAWEMVSMADSGGNPVGAGQAFSGDGDRALYNVLGGTPISDSGTPFAFYLAERTETAPHRGGWSTRVISPPRQELIAPYWTGLAANADLSSVVAVNRGTTTGEELGAFWRMGPGGPQKLAEVAPPLEIASWWAASEDHSVVATLGRGPFDPAHPAAATQFNIYEIGQGPPRLLSLLPGEAVSPCAVGGVAPQHQTHSLAADGRHLYFPSPGEKCSGPTQLYARDLQAAETKLVSGPPLSGPACSAALVRSVPGAAFFWTPSRLAAEDAEPSGCGIGGGDVYRYEAAAATLECLTCGVVRGEADVAPNGSFTSSSVVSEDGSRLYFVSQKRLVPGAPNGGLYRLALESSELAYVGPLGNPDNAFLTPNGAQLLFLSSHSALNPLGEGPDNAGTLQFYRYDDADRSLVCVSCPLDGSAPAGGVPAGQYFQETGRNATQLAPDGTIAFATPTALHPADQNTPAPGADPSIGTDVYEWRDGRQLLVTDGLTGWPQNSEASDHGPSVDGISPSGRDVYFSAAARLTPDAPDAFPRLYTARVGGGFEFPPPGLPPCDLNSGACEGPGTSAPDLPGAGSAVFEGQGDPRDPFPRDCSGPAKRAAKLNRAARSLRKLARRAARQDQTARAKRLRGKVRKLSRKAREKKKIARRCRSADRRASR